MSQFSPFHLFLKHAKQFIKIGFLKALDGVKFSSIKPNPFTVRALIHLNPFIRLRRKPRLRAVTHFGVQARALPVDECVTRASTLRVLKPVASADSATGG